MKNCPATADLTQSRRKEFDFPAAADRIMRKLKEGGDIFVLSGGELAVRSHLLEITVSNTLGNRLEGKRFPGGLLGGNFLQIEANREN